MLTTQLVQNSGSATAEGVDMEAYGDMLANTSASHARVLGSRSLTRHSRFGVKTWLSTLVTVMDAHVTVSAQLIY